MFGIGMTELMVILVVALIVFGPTRLPELARSLGRAMGEFRRASTDLRQTFSEAVQEPPKPEPAPPQPAPAIAPPAMQARADAAAAVEAEAPSPRDPSGSTS